MRKVAALGLVALFAAVACGVHSTDAPSLTGPSGYALSVGVSAVPDTVSQDGGSQSSIQILARDATGKPVSGQTFGVAMQMNGSPVTYGALSASTVVTGGDGTAHVVYTAPAPLPIGSPTPTCFFPGQSVALAGQCVSIVATPTGTNFAASQSQSVVIRLVPPGVVLPPGQIPISSFVVTPTPVNLNIPAVFDASASCGGPLTSGACNSSSTITQYAWAFGDGTTATGKTTSHTYASLGTFNAVLTVINSGGVSASSTQSIAVGSSSSPTAAFVFSPTGPAPGQTVVFNASASAAAPGHTLTQLNWIFGDGSTASGVIVSHAFTTVATYNVTLSVLDDAGQKNTASESVQVSTGSGGSSTAPTAKFTFSPAAPATGQTTFFNASTSTAGTGHSLASYSWNFGDGSTGTGVTPTHAYAAAGTFTVTLTVTDEIGQVGITTLPVTITSGSGGSAPTANFTFSPAAPGVGDTVFFNASSSAAGAGHTIASYAWTFGDGSTGTGVTPTHAYTTAGSYGVQLKVTDEIGQSTTSAPTSITVGSPPSPTANFTFSPLAPGRNDQVVFDASSSSTSQGQTIVDVAWNFGDGTPVIHCPGDPSCVNVGVTNRISAHTFTFGPQTYVVNLVVTDSAGRTGSHNTSVTAVAALPVVLITTSPGSPNPGITVNFNSNGTTYYPGSGPATFAWTFGDGTGSAVANPSKPGGYAAVGTYSVGLSVTDTKGRTGFATATVTVVAVTPPVPPTPPTASFTFGPPSPTAGVTNVLFDGSGSTGSNLTYSWNFGDGNILSSGGNATINHIYTVAGSYPATLTVTDSVTLLHSTSAAQTVTVVP